MSRHRVIFPLIASMFNGYGQPQRELIGYQVLPFHDHRTRSAGTKCHGRRSRSQRERSNRRKARR